MTRVGIISDTHGLLRLEAISFLQGYDHIIHGGDIGNVTVLAQLSAIAPLTVVRGNNDTGGWAEALAETELFQIGKVSIYTVHDIALMNIEPVSAGVHVVVSGHSHKPKVERHEGVLYVNPGSAGPRRFKLPVAVAELIITGTTATARIVELPVDNKIPLR